MKTSHAIITRIVVIGAFLVLYVLGVLWLLPRIFIIVKGLFENNDLGTIAGILAVFLSFGPLMSFGALVAIFLSGMVSIWWKK